MLYCSRTERFQTLINLIGIILFLPFLNQFSDFLEKRFVIKNKISAYFIDDADNLFPEAALEVLQKEVELFIFRVVLLNMEVFRIDQFFVCKNDFLNEKLNSIHRKDLQHIEKYENVKHTEGEIISLYTKMSQEHLEKDEFLKFTQLVSAARNAMYSAKCIKDIYNDRRELRESGQDTKFKYYELIQNQLKSFYLKLIEIPSFKENSTKFQELIKLNEQIQTDYEGRTRLIYKQVSEKIVNEMDIATLLNVNREVYSSCKAIILAMKDYSLDSKQAENFEDIPTLTIR